MTIAIVTSLNQNAIFSSKWQLQYPSRKISPRKFIPSWRGAYAAHCQKFNGGIQEERERESIKRSDIFVPPCAAVMITEWKRTNYRISIVIVRRIAWRDFPLFTAGAKITRHSPRDAWHHVRNTVYHEYCTLQFEEFNSRHRANLRALSNDWKIQCNLRKYLTKVFEKFLSCVSFRNFADTRSEKLLRSSLKQM